MLTLWLALFFNAHIIDTPVTWTANARAYEEYVAAPTADSCLFWGAREVKGHCEGDLVLASSPRNLRCKPDVRFPNVVTCQWEKPKGGRR